MTLRPEPVVEKPVRSQKGLDRGSRPRKVLHDRVVTGFRQAAPGRDSQTLEFEGVGSARPGLAPSVGRLGERAGGERACFLFQSKEVFSAG